jgi:hypothetical protein
MPRWQALMNISLPRKDDKDKQSDLIPPGETFEADENRVQNLLHPKFGPPRIRKIEEQKQEMPQILPRHVSNRQFGPPVDARPDPAKSSHVQVMVPELNEPQPDSEQRAEAPTDAVDIPPRRARAAAGARTGG